MRILIVSDTHGYERNLEKVLKKVGTIDAMIHCGDVEGHEDYIETIAGCPVHMVRGNNDFYTDLPGEELFQLGSKKVLLTHGHYFHVAFGTQCLKEEALSKGADIVCFGHTHMPVISQEEVTILNPGSLTYPRQEGRKPSFILMELDPRGEAHYHLNYLK